MGLSAHTEGCLCQDPVMLRVSQLYHELLDHDGFGELRIDVRILKRKQKEIIITCGKQYRYVIDAPEQFERVNDGSECLLSRAENGTQ